MERHVRFAMVAACLLAFPAWARGQTSPPFVAMSGEGTVKAAPDVATLRLASVTEGASIAKAVEENARRMASVVEAVLAAGVPRSQVRTEAISVQPYYATSKDGRTPSITGYTVRNAVSVRTRDIAALGTLIERAGSAGANEVSGPDFGIEETPEQLAAARRDAALDAKAKGEAYASALGIRLGRVLSVSEGETVRPAIPYAAGMRAMSAAPVPAPPVMSGTIEIRARVTVTWEVEQAR